MQTLLDKFFLFLGEKRFENMFSEIERILPLPSPDICLSVQCSVRLAPRPLEHDVFD